MRRTRFVLIAVAAAVALPATSAAWGNTLSASCNGVPNGCDETGSWQTSPVTLSWDASPVPSRSQGCETQTYTDAATTVSCDVWWGSASASQSFPLNVESSSPTISGAPDRPPDSSGWYNHPLAVGFRGSAFSGIRSCTESTTYAGPDSASAQVTGVCVDFAGKSATTSFTFAYDSTPPTLQAAADPGDGTVRLRLLAEDVAPLTGIEIARSPGLRHARTTLVYSGRISPYDDARVRNGLRYRYTFIVRDAAGNVAQRALTVVPGPRLLAPPSGAAVAVPPLLRWTPVRHATYYNVQLYRGGKILSAWPAHARLQLKPGWSFAGQRHRLRPGRYRWYVWPGFGRRAAARYGHVIGTGSFVVGG